MDALVCIIQYIAAIPPIHACLNIRMPPEEAETKIIIPMILVAVAVLFMVIPTILATTAVSIAALWATRGDALTLP